MKAERIQNDLPEIPGWQTQALLTAERRLHFPSFLAACRFANRLAERAEASAASTTTATPQLDIREGDVTLRLVAAEPDVLDAELVLIDALVGFVEPPE